MSSAARAVRKQTVASVNMGTDAKTKNKGKKMKKGKQNMEERQEETIEQDFGSSINTFTYGRSDRMRRQHK